MTTRCRWNFINHLYDVIFLTRHWPPLLWNLTAFNVRKMKARHHDESNLLLINVNTVIVGVNRAVTAVLSAGGDTQCNLWSRKQEHSSANTLQTHSFHHGLPGGGCLASPSPRALLRDTVGPPGRTGAPTQGLQKEPQRPGDHWTGGEAEEHRWSSGAQLAHHFVLAVCQRICGQRPLTAGRDDGSCSGKREQSVSWLEAAVLELFLLVIKFYPRDVQTENVFLLPELLSKFKGLKGCNQIDQSTAKGAVYLYVVSPKILKIESSEAATYQS